MQRGFARFLDSYNNLLIVEIDIRLVLDPIKIAKGGGGESSSGSRSRSGTPESPGKVLAIPADITSPGKLGGLFKNDLREIALTWRTQSSEI